MPIYNKPIKIFFPSGVTSMTSPTYRDNKSFLFLIKIKGKVEVSFYQSLSFDSGLEYRMKSWYEFRTLFTVNGKASLTLTLAP